MMSGVSASATACLKQQGRWHDVTFCVGVPAVRGKTVLRAKVHAKMPMDVQRKIFRLTRRLRTQHRPIRYRSVDEHRKACVASQRVLIRMVAINATRSASGS